MAATYEATAARIVRATTTAQDVPERLEDVVTIRRVGREIRRTQDDADSLAARRRAR